MSTGICHLNPPPDQYFLPAPTSKSNAIARVHSIPPRLKQDFQVICRRGSKGCNNEAELRALIAALREGKALGAKAVLVYCHSRVLVDQLGSLDVKMHVKPIARLASLFDEARQLLKSFEQASLQWIPRHRNAQADALARVALGKQPKLVLKASKASHGIAQ